MKRIGPLAVRHDTARSALTPARSRILEALQQADEPVTASALAHALGQHANTVREHLDALVERGLATRSPSEAHRRGRPAWLYSASAELHEPDARVRGHAMLALALAEQLARSSPQAQADALAAGAIWGQLLSHGEAPERGSALRRTAEVLGEIGFDPLVRTRTGTVLLRRCPFLDVARQQSQVVCSAHLGMIATVFESFGGSGGEVQLLPFAEPGGCVVAFEPIGDTA